MSTKTIWLMTPADDVDLRELLSFGWREVGRETFGSKVRIELTDQAPPPPDPPPGGGPKRNRNFAGPRIAFIKKPQSKAWTEGR